MSKEKIKLYRVQSILNKDGFRTKVTEWADGIEKQKVYICTRRIDKDETHTRHIKKDSLGVINNGYSDSTPSIAYSCLCLFSDIDKKQRECEDAVRRLFKRRKEEIDELLKHIDL